MRVIAKLESLIGSDPNKMLNILSNLVKYKNELVVTEMRRLIRLEAITMSSGLLNSPLIYETPNFNLTVISVNSASGTRLN